MPKDFDRLVSDIRKRLRGKENPRTGKPYTNSDIFAIATSEWKRMHGGKAPKREDLLSMLRESGMDIVEFYAPIEVKESVQDLPDGFKISGVAIDETISRNGIKYTAEELRKSAYTLKGKSLLDSHRQESIKDILGTVIEATFNEDSKSVEFTAVVKDKMAQEMIKDGRIQNVSIGARADDLIENETFKEAKGLEFLELSLVAVPGVANASISQGFAGALLEKFDFLKEAQNELEYEKMEEFDMETNEKVKSLEEDVKALQESKKEFEDLKAKLADATKENESLKRALNEYKTKEKEQLVSKVLEAEINAGIVKEDDEDGKKAEEEELKQESEEALASILKRLERFASLKEQESEGEHKGDESEGEKSDEGSEESTEGAKPKGKVDEKNSQEKNPLEGYKVIRGAGFSMYKEEVE